MQTERIYIIFDSPPGYGPSNFVDVKDEDGNSLSPEQIGATWQYRDDGYWALGPFEMVNTTEAKTWHDLIPPPGRERTRG